MSLNEEDLDRISDRVHREIEPVRDLVIKHNQCIYGSDGVGGMKREQQQQQKDIEELKHFRTQVKTIAPAIFVAAQATITIAIDWAKSLFKGH